MRITKDYGERKNEILDVSEKLFLLKGYEKCTVNDIIKEVSIAKGTFYYYFKSKKEVMDAIVERYIDTVISRVSEVINNDGKSPEEKLLFAFMAMKMNNQVGNYLIDEMHKVENALLHQKTLNQMITAMAPALVKIIEEGIEKKVWSCRYPLQYMQIFLASSLTLTDDGIFELDDNSKMKVMQALISMLEKLLEVPDNTFLNLFIKYQN